MILIKSSRHSSSGPRKDIASAQNLNASHGFWNVTGNSTIDSIKQGQDGDRIVLVVASGPITFNHNVPSGTFGFSKMILKGMAPKNLGGGDTIHLIFDKIDNRWLEI